MKRLSNSSGSTIYLHLTDIVKRIDHIVICEDLTRTPYTVSASENVIDDAFSNEQFYITFSDSQLLELTAEEIHQFKNIELIGRIAKLDVDLLSAAQLKQLKEAYSKKVICSKEDVEKILTMIQTCKSVSYDGRHWKTNKFLKDDSGSIRTQDCLDILHQLTIEDYVANSRSYNISHIGNHLIVFEPDDDWETNDGKVLQNLKIYVKLDIDESDQSAVALVSMHIAEHVDDYPYRENR